MVRFGLSPRIRIYCGLILSSRPHAFQPPRHLRSICDPQRYFCITVILQQRKIPINSKTQSHNPPKSKSLEGTKPETAQKLDDAVLSDGPRKDSLLVEHIVSNKEQRKADWAIMKEMSRYLWPDVARIRSQTSQ